MRVVLLSNSARTLACDNPCLINGSPERQDSSSLLLDYGMKSSTAAQIVATLLVKGTGPSGESRAYAAEVR